MLRQKYFLFESELADWLASKFRGVEDSHMEETGMLVGNFEFNT